MKPGLYALVSRDGAPHAPTDLRALGLPPVQDDAVAAAIVDPSVDGVHAGRDAADGATVVFAGFLDDPARLAEALDAPPATPVARLVRLALARRGVDGLRGLAGEWSLLFAAPGEVVLACSDRLRDPLHYRVDPGRVAAAPSLAALAELSGGEDGFAPLPLLLHMSAWSYRATLGSATWLNGVRRVEHGACVRITAAGTEEMSLAEPTLPTEPWRDGFEAAVEELDRMCRRILRAHLARHGDVAVQLSGGLDSSLLALLAVQEARPGQRVFAVSSVAPPGSGLADERDFIYAAADRLGVQVVEVSPRPDQSPYRPSLADQRHWESPGHGLRHDLYLALNAAAASGGATLALNGGFGEFSLSRRCRIATPSARLRAGAARRPLGPPLAPAKLGRAATSSTAPGLRSTPPFRAPELADFVARLPAGFTEAGGLPRALARALMRGALPPIVTERTSKGPFSPGHLTALQRHAPAARARLSLHRSHGADQWLDLDWLDRALAQMAQGAPSALAWSTRVQCTAMAAEFITWWRTRRATET